MRPKLADTSYSGPEDITLQDLLVLCACACACACVCPFMCSFIKDTSFYNLFTFTTVGLSAIRRPENATPYFITVWLIF